MAEAKGARRVRPDQLPVFVVRGCGQSCSPYATESPGMARSAIGLRRFLDRSVQAAIARRWRSLGVTSELRSSLVVSAMHTVLSGLVSQTKKARRDLGPGITRAAARAQNEGFATNEKKARKKASEPGLTHGALMWPAPASDEPYKVVTAMGCATCACTISRRAA